MESLIITLYASMPILASMAHAPQLRKAILSSPKELKGVSFMASGVWLLCSVVSILYGVLHLHDGYFIMVSAVGLAWNIAFLSVLIYKVYFAQGRMSQEMYMAAE